MGPNGSGKSTLAYVLAGREGYEVTGGEVRYDGEDLLELEPEERAAAGLFLAFQYPIEIPGVANMYFLRTALNALRRARGEDEIDAAAFLKLMRESAKLVGVKPELLKRSVNVGFSGGEKKRNEILQMAVLEPRLAILDETDSGLDIDALRTVADGVNRLRSPDRAIVVITHYQRLLDYIVPDRVHVLLDGRIVRSGGKELALELEQSGYAAFGAAPPRRSPEAVGDDAQPMIAPAGALRAPVRAPRWPSCPGARHAPLRRLARGELRALPPDRLSRAPRPRPGNTPRFGRSRAELTRCRSGSRSTAPTSRPSCSTSRTRCAWCSSTATSRRTCRTICLPCPA